jgi:hypothetical protein
VRELRCELAALRFRLALKQLFDRCAKANFNPNQPRVPRGDPDGGQWTDDSRWSNSRTDNLNVDPESALVLSDVAPGNFFKPGTRIAQAETSGRYSVNLNEEEQYGGHTKRDHVGKTSLELIEVLRRRRIDYLTHSLIGKRQGSFESYEAANDFVNRTLGQNRNVVDLVANGKLNEAFVKARFGHKTGREAFRPAPNMDPIIRSTYGVGVLIRHDPRSSRGFRVITSYPRND